MKLQNQTTNFILLAEIKIKHFLDSSETNLRKLALEERNRPVSALGLLQGWYCIPLYRLHAIYVRYLIVGALFCVFYVTIM